MSLSLDSFIHRLILALRFNSLLIALVLCHSIGTLVWFGLGRRSSNIIYIHITICSEIYIALIKLLIKRKL